ncbi:MAG TPA: helix-turn-helix domain-containing protein [Beijerinckiaceae bacterium]|jgi:excisionase family DNA binding protein|nr:helix-turn-helix domain-containing protein [Beijerinckiaceae bacterium]
MQNNGTTPATVLDAKMIGAPNSLAMSMPDFARALGISRATAYRLMKDRKLKTITVGDRRLVPMTEINRILSEAAFAA